jgi:hypothetical protein
MPQVDEMVEIPRYVSWKRRAVTTTSWFVSAAGLALLAPVALPVALVADLVMRRHFSVIRTYLFFCAFFWVECVGMVAALGLWLARPVARWDERRYQHLNRRLQYWWGRNLFWSAVRIFGVDVEIDGLELLEDPRPTLVLCRHASTLDTMLPIAVVRQMKYYRYVIKAELLADPAMDYVAQRFPNCFVHRGTDNPEEEARNVVALGKDLETTGAVVVYPEGTRYTPAKRARLLEKFGEDDPDDLLPVVESLNRTLPPLRQGARKLVETMTEADVLFIAHRGVDEAGAMSDLIKGRLTQVKLEVAMWRIVADDVPRDPDAVRQFLVEHWKRVDAFACGEELAAETRPPRPKSRATKRRPTQTDGVASSRVDAR